MKVGYNHKIIALRKITKKSTYLPFLLVGLTSALCISISLSSQLAPGDLDQVAQENNMDLMGLDDAALEQLIGMDDPLYNAQVDAASSLPTETLNTLPSGTFEGDQIQPAVGNQNIQNIPSLEPNLSSGQNLQPAQASTQLAGSVQGVQNTTNLQPNLNAEQSLQAPLSVNRNLITQEEQKPLDSEEISDFYKEGIDTVDYEESGNWFIKRRIWRKSKPLYERIRELVLQVESYQENFVHKRAEVAQKVNSFLLDIGINTGQVQEALNELEREIKEAQEKQGLDEQEREILGNLEKNKIDLQKLQEDFQILTKLNDLTRDTITQVVDQVQIIESYEQRAYKAYKQIGEILNHRQADVLYNTLENILDNLTLKNSYIENDLNRYFEKNIQEIETLMTEIQSEVNDLKQRGIILKEEFLAAQKKQEESNIEEQEPVASDSPTNSTEYPAGESLGIFSRVKNTIVEGALNLYKKVLGFFKTSNTSNKPAINIATESSEVDSIGTAGISTDMPTDIAAGINNKDS